MNIARYPHPYFPHLSSPRWHPVWPNQQDKPPSFKAVQEWSPLMRRMMWDLGNLGMESKGCRSNNLKVLFQTVWCPLSTVTIKPCDKSCENWGITLALGSTSGFIPGSNFNQKGLCHQMLIPVSDFQVGNHVPCTPKSPSYQSRTHHTNIMYFPHVYSSFRSVYILAVIP
jgi:hypothetical protein